MQMGLASVGFEASSRVMMLQALSSLWTQQRICKVPWSFGKDWMFLAFEPLLDIRSLSRGVYENRTTGVTIIVVTNADKISWVKNCSSMYCKNLRLMLGT